MQIEGDGFVLRPWQEGDEEDLVRHADNRKVWRNLTNRFPSPYDREAATGWIALNLEEAGPARNFAIVISDGRGGGEAIGGVGLERYADLHTRTAELGYWLGEAHWNKGIATRATHLLVDYAFATYDFVRLQAGVIAWNPASARVLEKSGFALESRQRSHVFKDGEIADLLLYVKLRDA